MRTLAGVFMLLTAVVFFADSAIAAETFPYRAYVADDDIPVRSGPGTAYYATGRLSSGAEVQVHRRDAGGWLAIRPPENSFSWVPARKVWRADEPNVVEVIGDDACSWLGSGVENVTEHKWQVRLQRGELLEVLGERELRDEATGALERWYKIAPPAGEFRWIQDRLVSHERSAWTDERDRPPARTEAALDVTPNQVRPVAFFAPERTAASTTSRPATSGSNNANNKADRRPLRALSRREAAGPRREPDDVRQLDVAFGSADAAPRLPLHGNHDLDEIDIELSQTVARDPLTWNLVPLRERTQQLIEQGATPLERGRARLLLEKIGQFEELQRRHVDAERPVTLPKGTSSTLKAVSAAESTSAFEPRFDGTGRLMVVHSLKHISPPFALMSEDGNHILQYVSPAPGLNLHRYVEKRVGIYGQRGFTNIDSKKSPHLTAQRIVDLDQHAK